MDEHEKAAYEKAYQIAVIGGSNPVGVALGVHEIGKVLHLAGFDSKGVAGHVAFRSAVAHLAFLARIGLGADTQDLAVLEGFRSAYPVGE